jgi:nucleolar GTP-binding protein
MELQILRALLVHVPCCLIYFLDLSEQCGHSIEQQFQLFESTIQPLCPVIVIVSEFDNKDFPYENLPSCEVRERIETMAATAGVQWIPWSYISEDALDKLKFTACNKLLEVKVCLNHSLSSLSSNKQKRERISMPVTVTVSVTLTAHDEIERTRGAVISEAVTTSNMDSNDKSSGGVSLYACDHRKYYASEDDEWKLFDSIAEFMDSKDANLFEADIDETLNAMEAEQECMQL